MLGGKEGFLLHRERLWYHKPCGYRVEAGRRGHGVGQELAKAIVLEGERGDGVAMGSGML